MLNRIQLIGRLARDPELRYVSNGHAMAQFTVAVGRDFKNAAGEREADFIRCIAWRKLAEQVGQYCAKGRLVAIEGRLQTRSYELPDGSRRTLTEVVGDRVWFLDSRRTDGEGDSVPGAEAAEGPADAAPELIGDTEEAALEAVSEP
jgi:single-strand DNA-binding protein